MGNGVSLRISKLLLAAHLLVGSRLSEIGRFTKSNVFLMDGSVESKCADTIRYIASLAGLDLEMANEFDCPDQDAVERHGVSLHPGNPNSFAGHRLKESEVRAGDLILFHETDPRYSGTGLVTHVGLIVDAHERLMVDASYQERIVCYRPWSTFDLGQIFGFWRLRAVYASRKISIGCARSSFADDGYRRLALKRVNDLSRRRTLEEWNTYLRKRELDQFLDLRGCSGPLTELLKLEREGLEAKGAREPALRELGPLVAPGVSKSFTLSGRLMKSLSRFLSRTQNHRRAREWRRRLGVLARPQNRIPQFNAWSEPSEYREYNNRLHRGWLERALGPLSFAHVLKTDLHDEAISNGLFESLKGRCETVYGVDIDGIVLQKAQERFPQLETVQCDVRCLPFPDRFFQLIVSNSTLDHFPSIDGLDSALRELSRITDVGGYLAVTLDNPENPIIALRNKLPHHSLLTKFGLAPYYRGATLTLERLCDRLESLGYEVLERDFLFHVPRVLLVHTISRLSFRHRVFAEALRWEQRVPSWWRRRTGCFVAVVARKRDER